MLAATLLISTAAILLLARSAHAQDSPAVARPWFEEITVKGFVSSSYSYNFARPPSRTNAYRVFDFDDNTFELDVAELVVQHLAKPHAGGF